MTSEAPVSKIPNLTLALDYSGRTGVKYFPIRGLLRS